MNGAISSASADAQRDRDEDDEGQIVLQQLAHPHSLATLRSAPQMPVPDPSGAGHGVASPTKSPRPDWIRSKDR